MGWQTVLQVEIDDWCRKVLKKNFPKAKQHGDIKTFDGKPYRGKIDILSGGFPCQPFSLSGNRKGTGDDRYLWPELYRALKEIRPRFAVFENVPGIVNMGLDKMLDDLEGAGYTCWTPLIVPSGATGTDHLRERVWVVADSNSYRLQAVRVRSQRNGTTKDKKRPPVHSPQIITREQFEKRFNEPLLLTDKDGLPPSLDCRNILKAAGNAIVPQLAFEIFKHIENFFRLKQQC